MGSRSTVIPPLLQSAQLNSCFLPEDFAERLKPVWPNDQQEVFSNDNLPSVLRLMNNYLGQVKQGQENSKSKEEHKRRHKRK
jgi:hypothetical protein